MVMRARVILRIKQVQHCDEDVDADEGGDGDDDEDADDEDDDEDADDLYIIGAVCDVFAYFAFLPFLYTFGSKNKRKSV